MHGSDNFLLTLLMYYSWIYPFLAVIFLALHPSFSTTLSSSLIHRSTDSEYRGHFLDIDELVHSLGISRLTAHEIQNHFRDQIASIPIGEDHPARKYFLAVSLDNSINSVSQRFEEEFQFRPMELRNNDFLLVIDLEATLLSQWYELGTLVGDQRKGSFTVAVPDQKYGTSKPENSEDMSQPVLRISGTTVQLRPGILEFLSIIKSIPEFQGIILYSDMLDTAMWSLLTTWKRIQPEFFQSVLGAFSRNHLRYQRQTGKALKDLRVFDPGLRNIFSIDDRENKILQPHLNYRIPAFNAQAYIQTIQDTQNKEGELVRALNQDLLPYLGRKIKTCSDKARSGSYGGILSYCFQAELGTLSQHPIGELQTYYKSKESLYPIEGLRLIELFEPQNQAFMEIPLRTTNLQ